MALKKRGDDASPSVSVPKLLKLLDNNEGPSATASFLSASRQRYINIKLLWHPVMLVSHDITFDGCVVWQVKVLVEMSDAILRTPRHSSTRRGAQNLMYKNPGHQKVNQEILWLQSNGN